ncbi:hypothetical protein COOONC_20579 [Cooperia oncophora]
MRCSTHVPDQFVDEFAKALIGMNYEQMKKNDQVHECSTPSECASIWSQVGAKHLREKFVFYRAKGLYERSAALAKLFNTLVQHKDRKETRKQQETRGMASLLKKQWKKLPLTISEEFRRSFCAFRMLDENTNRDSYEPDK